MKRGIFARAVGLAAAVTLLSSAAFADDSQSLAYLSISRILGTPNHGDAVQFTNAGQTTTTTGTPSSAFQFSMPLAGAKNAPTLFGNIGPISSTDAATQALSPSDAQVLGLSFKLLGGQSSVSFIDTSPSSKAAAGFGVASQGPAVFAFYDFPEAQAASPLGGILGLHTGPAALAAQVSGTPDNFAAASSLMPFPLVNSLSAQGPYWYGENSPALSGSSVQLSIPLKLANLGVKVRLGEQSLETVQSNSLASQILGPAFASASNYNAFNGGMTVALPLLNRRATVSLDGLYETLAQTNGNGLNPNASSLPLGIAPTGPASGPIVLYPSATDMQQYVGAASLAVPVTSRLTVKGSFSEQLAGSVDLNALTQSLTQHTTAYAGGLVYNIPKTNSSINLFFNRNVYTDDASSSTWAQNQQNLYFSVKF